MMNWMQGTDRPKREGDPVLCLYTTEELTLCFLAVYTTEEDQFVRKD